MHLKKTLLTSVLVAAFVCLPVASAFGEVRIYAITGGTMADGCLFGPFDGLADHADWYQASFTYSGSIALAPVHGMEHRVVFKFDLSSLAGQGPVEATLHLTIRGAMRYNIPDAQVHVYSYTTGPSLTLSDFNDGPAALQASISVSSPQPPTEFVVEISEALNEALAAGADTIAFRLQIDPESGETGRQVFMHAPDFHTPLKPYIVIHGGASSDCDGDGDADLADFSGFAECQLGPGESTGPGCNCLDVDEDGDVDLKDFAGLQVILTSPSP